MVKHSYAFNGASARDIYEALLDSNRAAVWTHGKSKVSKKIGSKFEFFDGNVHGVLLQTVRISMQIKKTTHCVYRPLEKLSHKLGDSKIGQKVKKKIYIMQNSIISYIF